MDTRLTTTHGLRASSVRRPAAALLVAVALLAMLAVPASAAPTDCLVTNTDTGQTSAALQQAVDAATPGHRLTVEGTCHGTTVIEKDLVITGIQAATSGRPVLDGDGLGTVVTVLGVIVMIEDLTIEDGRSQVRAGSGLTNEQGTLTLRDVIVRRHQGRRSCIFNTGTLTMTGASRIADCRGLGVYNGGSLTMNGASSISANDRMGVHLRGGGLTMNGHSSIRDNGVGVHAAFATIVMNDRSSIRGSDSGVGVHLERASLTMNDTSTITENRSSGRAGGVRVGGSSALTMRDSATITHNTADLRGVGSGVSYREEGELVGVICAPKRDANVFGNSPDDCLQHPR